MNVRQSFILILSSFIFTLSSCRRSTEPIYNPQNLQLKVVDVSCTEAWLSLQAKSDYLNKTLKLFKNDSLILEKPLTTKDSLLYIDNLWPNTSYRFQVTLYDGPKLMARSATVTATTMDTTSHDFTWQTYEFGGQGGSSAFYDVAIIDENDIWAVGEIYTGNDQYNAAHWDGEKWELKKIANDSYPRRVVYAFGKNDVWFDGSIKWDGTRYSVHMKNFPLLPNGDGWYKNAMWGVSSEDFYVVGDHGMIAHYDGQKWERIESGTEEKINDIWGITKNNQNIIYCVSGKVLSHTIPGVIKIERNRASPIEWPYQEDRIPHSVWFKKSEIIFVAGGEVALKDYTQTWRIISHLPRYYIHRIRGNANNDLFIAGAYSILAHFNGYNWYLFESGNSAKHYESLDFKGNLVVVVGHIGGRIAFIKMGKR